MDRDFPGGVMLLCSNSAATTFSHAPQPSRNKEKNAEKNNGYRLMHLYFGRLCNLSNFTPSGRS
jgi:hypothetical protein